MFNSSNRTQTPLPNVRDDLFENHNVFYTLAVVAANIVGMVTNSINMAVFAHLGSRDTINISLFSMSLSDFLVCLTGSFTSITELPLIQRMILYKLNWHPRDFYSAFSGQFHIVFARITLTITGFVTLERCLCVAIPLKVKMIFTSRVVKLVIASCYVLTITGYLPIFLSFQYSTCFYPSLGYQINCYAVNVNTFTFFRRHGLLATSVWVFYCLPFCVIVVCTGILIVVLKRKMKWRHNVTSSTTSDKSTAKETGVIRMMVMVSSLFIVCNIPMATVFMWNAVDDEFHVQGALRHITFLVMSIAYVFEAINSSANILIYYNFSSKYKEMFCKMFNIKRA